MAAKRGDGSHKPGKKKGSRGQKPEAPARRSPQRAKKKPGPTPADDAPLLNAPGEPTAPAFDFLGLKSHRKGSRKVPVAISLKEASDAADAAMEIASLLRSSEANLAMVKQRQQRVVKEAQAQIDNIRQRFDEEAQKWETRKAPKTRTGIWAFNITDKDDEHPHGKKYFACSDTGVIHGPDPITKDDLEAIKQDAIVNPSELKKVAKLALETDAERQPDVIITPDMLGFPDVEKPKVGECDKCGVTLYPQDGHYTYKGLLFCRKDSECGKCKRVVMLDKDEFHRVINGCDTRVCGECAEQIDATGSGTHTPVSNRAKLKIAKDASAPPATDDEPPPPPKGALVPHVFHAGVDPARCDEPECNRPANDVIHDLEDDEVSF